MTAPMEMVAGLSDGTSIKRSSDGEYFFCDRNADPEMEYGPLTLDDLREIAELFTQAIRSEDPDGTEDGAS
jgi:hypothetical protein